METNKKNKQLKIIFFIFIVSLGLCFYTLYTIFLYSYNEATYNFLNDIQDLYPEVTIPKALFTNNFTFQLTWQVWVLIFIVLVCLFMIYHYVSHSYQSYSKDVQHIIQEIDTDEFTPSILEGELSLLEEKVYFYKKRNEKLLETNEREKKQMSDYIENIAHQLKTPISSIRLTEEVALVSNNPSLLEKNKSSFERLDNLFDNFMKLSRIENETIHFHLEVGSMNELLDDVYQQVLPLLKKTKLEIKSCDTQFYYDIQWLSEALYNIIKNCIEEGVSVIEVDTFSNHEMNHIVIRDNGKGIHEDDLPYIFDRFYRSKSNKKQGIGIGLALTKEIVEKHQGFINAYNENGAVFDLSFPVLDIKEKVI